VPYSILSATAAGKAAKFFFGSRTLEDTADAQSAHTDHTGTDASIKEQSREYGTSLFKRGLDFRENAAHRGNHFLGFHFQCAENVQLEA